MRRAPGEAEAEPGDGVLRREWIVRPTPAEIRKAKDGNRTTDLGIWEALATLVRAVSSRHWMGSGEEKPG